MRQQVNVTRGREEETEEQEEALLARARDSLYLTMDRIRDNKHHVSIMSILTIQETGSSLCVDIVMKVTNDARWSYEYVLT